MSAPAIYSHAPSRTIVNAVLGAMPAVIDVWNTSSAAPLTITHKFATAVPPVDMWSVYRGWKAFTAAQKSAVSAVLAEYESVINVKFVAIASLDPDIDFGRVNLSGGEAGEGGYRYTYATLGGVVSAKTLDGFSVFGNQIENLSKNLILHELGHAMTLKHTGNYHAGGGSAPGPYLPAGQDNNKYTVMSYKADPDNGALSPHLGIYDIAALQARFGANLAYRTGNDTYTGPNGVMQAIWDAGGIDTLSGAGPRDGSRRQPQ